MIIDFYGNGGGSGGVTSGEVENMISSALTDYYTSNETDEAIDDAVDAIDFDTLEAVPDFPSAATQGDVVAIEGSAGYPNGITVEEYAVGDMVGKRFTFPVGCTDDLAEGELIYLGKVGPEGGSIYDMNIASDGNGGTVFTYEDPFDPMLSIYMSIEEGDEGQQSSNDVYFEYHNVDDNYYTLDIYTNPTVDEIVFEDIQESKTMGVYQYDGTDWKLIEGGGSGNIVTLTQQEYEALTTKDPDTLYVISDATPIDLADYALNSAVTALQASKADAQSISANTGTTSPYSFPSWNSQGIITGEKIKAYSNSWYVNGGLKSGLLCTSNNNWPSVFAPTSAGTAGQMLMSAGSGAPTWTTYKFAFLTQTEYDALTTPDSTTFYFVTGD